MQVKYDINNNTICDTFIIEMDVHTTSFASLETLFPSSLVFFFGLIVRNLKPPV